MYVVPGIIPFCSSTRRRCELSLPAERGRPSGSKQYFTQTIYKFPDSLVGGSDCAFVSTAAELKFNRNPAIHPT